MDPAPRSDSLNLPAWLLSPEHLARMGGAVWVFLWLWNQTDPAGGPYSREVRAGSPVRVDELCEALGLPERTVRRHLAQLRDEGYLNTFRESHAFTAVISIWRPDGPGGGLPAKNGRSLKTQSDLPKMAGHPRNDESPAKNGRSQDQDSAKFGRSGANFPAKNGRLAGEFSSPPGPPLKEQELFLDIPGKQGSSLPDPGFLLRTNNNKSANVVPIRPDVEGPSASSGPDAAVAVGQSPERLRREQAARHHLGRIDAWERPELNRTLLEALCGLSATGLNEVFEVVCRMHRTRRKDLDNPAGWWASMLIRSAQAWRKANRLEVRRE